MMRPSDRTDCKPGADIDRRQNLQKSGAIDDQPQRQAGNDATALKQRGFDNRSRNRQAGVVQDGGQPAGEKENIQKAAEKDDPQQDRTEGPALTKEMQHRNPGRLLLMHDKGRSFRENRRRIDAMQHSGDFRCGMFLQHEMAKGFGKRRDHDGGQDERKDTADHEHGGPSELRDQAGRQESAQSGAEREAAEHRHRGEGAVA
jgi:hypothetical protein